MKSPSDAHDIYLDNVQRIEPNISTIWPDAMLVSIAISQKRIADATELQAESLKRIADMLEYNPNAVLSDIIATGMLKAGSI